MPVMNIDALFDKLAVDLIDGVDEAVTKMIWLAVGIVVAMAATAFFMAKFNQAKANVPDPVAP